MPKFVMSPPSLPSFQIWFEKLDKYNEWKPLKDIPKTNFNFIAKVLPNQTDWYYLQLSWSNLRLDPMCKLELFGVSYKIKTPQ